MVTITLTWLGGEEHQFNIDPKECGGESTAWGWRYTMKEGVAFLIIRPRRGERFEIPLAAIKHIYINTLDNIGPDRVRPGVPVPDRGHRLAGVPGPGGIWPQDGDAAGAARRSEERLHGWSGVPIEIDDLPNGASFSVVHGGPSGATVTRLDQHPSGREGEGDQSLPGGDGEGAAPAPGHFHYATCPVRGNPGLAEEARCVCSAINDRLG